MFGYQFKKNCCYWILNISKKSEKMRHSIRIAVWIQQNNVSIALFTVHSWMKAHSSLTLVHKSNSLKFNLACGSFLDGNISIYMRKYWSRNQNNAKIIVPPLSQHFTFVFYLIFILWIPSECRSFVCLKWMQYEMFNSISHDRKSMVFGWVLLKCVQRTYNDIVIYIYISSIGFS